MRLAAMYAKQMRYAEAEHQLLRLHTSVTAAGSGVSPVLRDNVIKAIVALYKQSRDTQKATAWAAKLGSQ
jgi:hypothetical protein